MSSFHYVRKNGFPFFHSEQGSDKERRHEVAIFVNRIYSEINYFTREDNIAVIV